mmetsp:Transcript_23387/g.29484  ORF Transcript_23387/g.29484 Transcript_23387/m.29484 type:complete len:162 (+) Transcript_23387:15-500(+)
MPQMLQASSISEDRLIHTFTMLRQDCFNKISQKSNQAEMEETGEERENRGSPDGCMISTKNSDAAVHKTLECPLFMDGLPPDFESNPSLAALASLLGEDEEPEKDEVTENNIQKAKLCISGGGKVSRKKAPKYRITPYQSKRNKTKASLGEAQLFLKMWKL